MRICLCSKPAKGLAATLTLCCALGHAQNTPPAEPLPQASQASLHDTLLAKAASLYYSTARAGLRSFDCQVHPDWARMMKSARKGAPLPDDDPRLPLLNTVTITLNADLKGGSNLDWQLPSHPRKPINEDQVAMLNQVHHGIEQSLGGLMKMWMSLVNGSVAESLGEESADISQDANGYTLRSKDRNGSVTEVFDRGLVLKVFDLEGAATSSVKLMPVYRATPQGLLPASFVAETREPGAKAEAPAQGMDVEMEYQAVSGIEIPSRITLGMPDIVEMDFKLDGCTVNPR
jgi:hypothetical protein